MKKSENLVEVIPAPYSNNLIEKLYKVAKELYMPPSTYFLVYSILKKNKGVESLIKFFPQAFCEFLIQYIYILLEKIKVPDGIDRGGFEIWIGNSGSKSKTPNYLHIDNDEYLRVSSAKVITPIYGTILYLTPQNLMKGGGTIFFKSKNIEFELFSWHPTVKLISAIETVKVENIPGNIVIFKGDLPHAVLPYELTSNYSRINLLINIWDKRISSVPKEITFLTYD